MFFLSSLLFSSLIYSSLLLLFPVANPQRAQLAHEPVCQNERQRHLHHQHHAGDEPQVVELQTLARLLVVLLAGLYLSVALRVEVVLDSQVQAHRHHQQHHRHAIQNQVAHVHRRLRSHRLERQRAGRRRDRQRREQTQVAQGSVRIH